MIRIEGIQRPDLNHPDAWASVMQTHTEWLRTIGPQIGIDTPKAILGNVLGTIHGDDPNCFGFKFMPEWMDQAKRNLQIRMNSEISTPELPNEIRNRLSQVRSQVLLIDWNKEEGYTQAKKLWTREVKNFVQHQLAMHKEYRDAEKYYLSIAPQLSPFWQDFLHG